eukprot:522217_1
MGLSVSAKYGFGNTLNNESNQSIATVPSILHLMYSYYKVWHAHPTPQTDLKMIDMFQKVVMEPNALLTNTIIGPVLSACARAKNVAFADKVWMYVTSKNPINCKTKPNGHIYSEVLKVFTSVTPVDLYKCSKVVNRWIAHYKQDKQSLQVGWNRQKPYDHAVVLNQMMKAILGSNDLSVLAKQEYIRYYQSMMNELGITPNQETDNILGLHQIKGLQKILSRFNKRKMEKGVIIQNYSTIETVLDACIVLKDSSFADKVYMWDYIANQTNPGEAMFNKLLSVYQSVDIVPIHRCKILMNQWMVQVDTGVISKGFNHRHFLNQVMSIVWFKSDLSMMERKVYLWDCYGLMVTSKIGVDAVTIGLLQQSMHLQDSV